MAGFGRFLGILAVSCSLTVASLAFLVRGCLGIEMGELGRWVKARPRPPVDRSVRMPPDDRCGEPVLTVLGRTARAGRLPAPAAEIAAADPVERLRGR